MTRSRLISSHVNHYTQTSYHLSLLYLVRSHFRSHDQSSDPDMLPYLISDPSRRSALVSRKLFLFSLAPNICIELRCSLLFCFLQERRFRLSICQVHSFMNCRECAHLRPSHEGFSTFFFFLIPSPTEDLREIIAINVKAPCLISKSLASLLIII